MENLKKHCDIARYFILAYLKLNNYILFLKNRVIWLIVGEMWLN